MFDGIFGGLFDLDHDGGLNSIEKAMELGFLDMMDEDDDCDYIDNDSIFDDDDF